MQGIRVTRPDENWEHISYVVSLENMFVHCEPSSVTKASQCEQFFWISSIICLREFGRFLCSDRIIIQKYAHAVRAQWEGDMVT